MYPRVWLNDGKLESIADKKHTALVYREKIYLLADLIHTKIFKDKRLDDLMFIKKYGKHICLQSMRACFPRHLNVIS